MSDKLCLECGEKVLGRSDKKFCNDYCRNAYNNKLDVGNKNLVRNINNALKKNYKILTFLNPSGKTKISKRVLETKGFYFEYFTSIYKTQAGKVYYYCYDQGYLLLENEQVLLVQQKS